MSCSPVTLIAPAYNEEPTCVESTKSLLTLRYPSFEILVVMAGNGKDDPHEIPRLLTPIRKGEADYVQGSRFLEGGARKSDAYSRISERPLGGALDLIA